jgi:hypothetical protein
MSDQYVLKLHGSFQKFCTLYVFSLKMNLFYKIHLQAFNVISMCFITAVQRLGKSCIPVWTPSLLMRLITQVTSLDTSSVLLKSFPRSGFFTFGNKSKSGGLYRASVPVQGCTLPYGLYRASVPVQGCTLPYGLYRASVPLQGCTLPYGLYKGALYHTACIEPQCLYKGALYRTTCTEPQCLYKGALYRTACTEPQWLYNSAHYRTACTEAQ